MPNISEKEQSLLGLLIRQRYRDKRYYDYVLKPMLALRHWGYTLAYYVRKPFVFWRKPKKYFITFGDGETFCPSYLAEDARRLGLFDTVIAYWPKSLSASFRRKHDIFLRAQKRGYGYWIWKPELIWHTLKRMRDGDILLYLDTGHVMYPDKEGLAKPRKAMQELAHTPSGMSLRIIGTPLRYEWCKKDTFAFLDVPLPLTQSQAAYTASFILLRKCPNSMRVIRHWQELVGAQFYFLFDDSPSLLPNPPEFIEHRHDQSVFSILAHTYAKSSYIYSAHFPEPTRLRRRRKKQLLAGKATVDSYAPDTPEKKIATKRWLAWRKSWT